jgi:hypothetical protein
MSPRRPRCWCVTRPVWMYCGPALGRPEPPPQALHPRNYLHPRSDSELKIIPPNLPAGGRVILSRFRRLFLRKWATGSVLSALGSRQPFVVPVDLRVIFVLGLSSHQNKSAFVHLTTVSRHLLVEIVFMVRCGSKNHDSFVSQRFHRIEPRGFHRGPHPENQADSNADDDTGGRSPQRYAAFPVKNQTNQEH